MSQDLIKSIEKLIENGNVSKHVSSIVIDALPIIRKSRLQSLTESVVDSQRILSIYTTRKQSLIDAGITAHGLDETLRSLTEETRNLRLLSFDSVEYHTVVFCDIELQHIFGIFYFRKSTPIQNNKN